MTWAPPPTRTTNHKITAGDDWNPVVESLAHLELIWNALQTSTVTINNATSGAANSILLVGTGAIDMEAAPYRIVMDAPSIQRVQVATTSPSVFLGLYDGGAGTPIRAKLGQIQANATGLTAAPFHREYLWTPSAGSHTPQLRAYANTADDWDAHAGAADGDTFGPISLQIYRVPF